MNKLVRPIVSEKTIALAEKLNQYTFLVDPSANKIEVAKTVADKFGVKVEKVRMANYLGKKVMFGRARIGGSRSNYKKAVVTLKTGDSIDLFNIK